MYLVHAAPYSTLLVRRNDAVVAGERCHEPSCEYMAVYGGNDWNYAACEQVATGEQLDLPG